MSSLLDRAIAAHGGAAAVTAGRAMRVQLRLRGNILATRLRSSLVRPYNVTVDTRRPYATLEPFHRPGRVGIFDGDEISIREGDRTVATRSGARAHAASHVVWDELDVLYFVGYAMWNYMLTPYYFTWPGMEVRELDGDRLEVTYPEGFPTHCRTQTFHFASDGSLLRLDYTAEIFGAWARGAHLLEDHRRFDGLLAATHRHVRPKFSGAEPKRWFPAAMEGWLDDVRLV